MPITLQILFGVAAGIVAVGTVMLGFWWLVKPRVEDWLTAELLDPVRRTEHQVTANHHSSVMPTVLDRIDDVRSEQIKVRTDLNATRVDTEKAREATISIQEVLNHHMARSEKAQGRIEAGVSKLKDEMLINSREIKTSHVRLANDNDRMDRFEEALAETSSAITAIAESQKALWPALETIANATPPTSEKGKP